MLPPPPNLFKINFDGAVFPEANWIGIGVVIRYCQGLVIASMSQQLPYLLTSLEVEAATATRALEFALEVGINQATLEGDSLLVIQALTDDSMSFVGFGSFIKDAMFFYKCFHCLNFPHTRREGNNLAHNLAKHSINVLDILVWIDGQIIEYSRSVINAYSLLLHKLWVLP